MSSDPLRSAYGRGRLTAPRRAAAIAVCSLPGAFTVDELAEKIRATAAGPTSVASVYRAVSAMDEAGFIERVGEREGAALYAKCGTAGHHHHIVCDGCGRVAPAECPVDSGTTSRRPDGFVVTRHEVTLYGMCPTCAEEGS